MPPIVGIAIVVGVTVLALVFIRDEDDDTADGPFDSGAHIQQCRAWKAQATSYSDYDDLNDSIDQARKRL